MKMKQISPTTFSKDSGIHGQDLICTHEDEEESEASIEGRDFKPCRVAWITHCRGSNFGISDIRAVSVERWDEGGAKGEPESTYME